MPASMRTTGRSSAAGTWTSRMEEHGIDLPPTPAASSRAGSKDEDQATWPRAAVGYATLANLGKSSENQDSYVASSNGSKCFVGVFDGHGMRGKRLSEFAKDTLSRNLMEAGDLHSNPKQALEGAYQATQREIELRKGLEAAESGTTAVAAYQHRDRLFVANVGDSRAVLGRSEGSGVRAMDLSSDHKPSREDEKRRIIAAGGRIDQSQIPLRTARGGVRWVRVGPERVMTSDGMGGLAMSRSLGDLRLRPAVSAIPEMQEKRLDSRDKVMILGSDGVWDHVSSQEAVDIAVRRDNPNAAAKEIADIAKRRWCQETEGQISDDITAVVVRFDHSGNSRSGARPPSNASLFTASSQASGASSVPASAPPFATSGERSPKWPGGKPGASGPLAGAAGIPAKPRPVLPAVQAAGTSGRGRFPGQRAGPADLHMSRGRDAHPSGHSSAVAAAGRPSIAR